MGMFRQKAGKDSTQIIFHGDVHVKGHQTSSQPAQADLEEVRQSDGADKVAQVVFQVDNEFESIETDEQFIELVSAAAVASESGSEVLIKVVPVDKTWGISEGVEPLHAARHARLMDGKADVFSSLLTKLFSHAVRDVWGRYFSAVGDMTVVARALFLISGRVDGTKLDVWRTDDPKLSAPAWLSSVEEELVLSKFDFSSMDNLASGAGWRAADELPRLVLHSKVMPSILWAVVQAERQNKMSIPSKALALHTWHIGQG